MWGNTEAHWGTKGMPTEDPKAPSCWKAKMSPGQLGGRGGDDQWVILFALTIAETARQGIERKKGLVVPLTTFAGM